MLLYNYIITCLFAGLSLCPGVVEAGPVGPVGQDHEAGQDEERQHVLYPVATCPVHQTRLGHQQAQAHAHVNISDVEHEY